jgi:hypothetical protein
MSISRTPKKLRSSGSLRAPRSGAGYVRLLGRSMHRDYILAIASGFFALAGVGTGTVLSAHYAERQFDRQFEISQRDKVLTKRFELIEQCARARADLVRAKMIMGLVDVEKLRILAMARANKKQREGLEKVKTGVESIEMQKEFATIRANYSACLQMAGIFFGPKTKEAVLKMNSVKIWYEDPDSPELKALIEALLNELQYFPPRESP